MFKKDSPHDFQITVTMRMLSLAVAGFIVFSFFIFIGGYFLGKQSAAQEFAYKADQDSLADQIYSSMCVLYDVKDENDESAENSEDGEISESSCK
jgi:hypothetical protein